MTSLSDVYEGGVGVVADPRQRMVGAATFLVGVVMVGAAIPLATTDLAGSIGLSVFEGRKLAGILAGLGVPGVFVGILTVLPAGRATKAAAAIGASLSVLGVALFAYAYPYNWVASNPALAVTTTLLYSVGTLVTFWCLFVGVATFKTRNDPGGSARFKLTEQGEFELVSDESGPSGMGGIGLFGTEPDGAVETQTNRETDDEETVVADPSIAESTPTQTPPPAGDGAGGIQTESVEAPATSETDIQQAVHERGSPDRYCGNCTHFEYRRADGEMVPYCGFHEELMEDMDACDQWDENR